MKVKVQYTLLGWIDIEIPDNLEREKIPAYVRNYINQEITDEELIKGLDNGPWGMDTDQIDVTYIEKFDYEVDPSPDVIYDKERDRDIEW